MDAEARRADPEGQKGLTGAFLLAAAIDPEGNLDLAAVREGRVDEQIRVAFSLGPEGEVLQQQYRKSPAAPFPPTRVLHSADREPVDMVFLAACLTGTFRELTPPLFRLAGRGRSKQPRLLWPGPHHDQARLRLLHDAFNLYLMAYEAHLV